MYTESSAAMSLGFPVDLGIFHTNEKISGKRENLWIRRNLIKNPLKKDKI